MTTLAPTSTSVTRLGLFAYALAVFTIAADQISKAWMLYGLHLIEYVPIQILPIFRLSLVWNKGFSFGLMSGNSMARWGLFAFSIGVAIALGLLWARRTTRWLAALALGLIMGGRSAMRSTGCGSGRLPTFSTSPSWASPGCSTWPTAPSPWA